MRGARRALLGVAMIAAATAAVAPPPIGEAASTVIEGRPVVDQQPDVDVRPTPPVPEPQALLATSRSTEVDVAPPPAKVSVAPAEPQPDPVGRVLPVVSGGRGIPAVVRAAYERAAEVTASADPGCGLSWELLAAVGRIESGHASGGRVDENGTTQGRILGPRLDGTIAGVALIRDSDGGELDGDTAFDRAVGPMQFLPATWARYGADGNDDGRRDPHNVNDASLAAARYLCAGGGDLREPADLTAALFRYNRSVPYGLDVRAWTEAYRTGGAPVIPGRPGPVPEPSPEPVEPPVSVLAQPEGAALAGATSSGSAPTSSEPVTDPSPQPATDTEGSAEATTDGSTTTGTPEPDTPSNPDEPAVTGPGEPPTTTPDGTTADPAAECTSVVLTPTAVTVLPDGSGVLFRFPLDELPSDCTITAATLAFDPGEDAAERAVQVERVTGEWSGTTSDAPETDGDPVVAQAAVGERLWSVEELITSLVEDPERGVMLTAVDEGDPVSLEDADIRLEVALDSEEAG